MERAPFYHDMPYPGDFVKKLYPLGVQEPVAIFLDQFDSCEVAKEGLVRIPRK